MNFVARCMSINLYDKLIQPTARLTLYYLAFNNKIHLFSTNTLIIVPREVFLVDYRRVYDNRGDLSSRMPRRGSF